MRNSVLLFVLSLFYTHLHSQSVYVVVMEEGANTPLVGATLRAISGTDTITAYSDENGQSVFTFPVFPQQIIITYVGFSAQEIVVERPNSAKKPVIVTMTGHLLGCPVVVRALGTPLVSHLGHTISRDEALRSPAAFFDPARVAATRPGVLQAQDGTNALSLHGLHPDWMRWQIHGLDVVNPNHLPNAGTLADRAAQSAGGVFLVSSQALGASKLYEGATPSADAVGGLMDITLREGSPETRRTAQVGLLGLEVAQEGSVLKNRVQYLANYRYSTIGLLSKLGVPLGDEAIVFQDFNLNAVYAGRRGLKLRTFALLGQSTNDFEGDTLAEPVRMKNYQDIGFESKTGIVGFQSMFSLKQGWSLEAGSAWSAQRNERIEVNRFLGFLPYDLQKSQRLSNRIAVKHLRTTNEKRNLEREATIGLVANNINQSLVTDGFRSPDVANQANIWTLQPFVQWQLSGFPRKTSFLKNDWVAALVEVQNLYVPQSGQFVPQPRAQLSWRPNNARLTFQLAAGRTVQLPLWDRDAETAKALVGWQQSFGAQWSYYHYRAYSFSARVFHKFIEHIPGGSLDGYSYFALSSPWYDQFSNRSVGLDLAGRIEKEEKYALSANCSLFDNQLVAQQAIEIPLKYNTRYIANVMAERHFSRIKKSKKRVHSFSARTVLAGKQNLREPSEISLYGIPSYTTQPSSLPQSAYFRTDVRYQRVIQKNQRRKHTFAFEVQNVTNQQNTDYYYYDAVVNAAVEKKQLGVIPNVVWRVEW